MERLDSSGVEYEMSRDLTIDIMQYILNEFDGRVKAYANGCIMFLSTSIS